MMNQQREGNKSSIELDLNEEGDVSIPQIID